MRIWRTRLDISLKFQLFTILLVTGLMLVGAEIFVPGGILGIIGGIALLGSVIMGFAAFGPVTGGYVALGIVILVGLVIFLWIRIFPGTSVGRSMTVSGNLSKAKGTADGVDTLTCKTGTALSDLRPSGFALIDDRRVDVITRGEMLEKDGKLEVVKVEGNRVIVQKQES